MKKFNVVDKFFGYKDINGKLQKVKVRITYLNGKAINFQLI